MKYTNIEDQAQQLGELVETQLDEVVGGYQVGEVMPTFARKNPDGYYAVGGGKLD